MPYARDTLTSLRSQVAQDIAAALPGSDPLLRYSPLKIMGEVQAGLAHLNFGFLDYIAQQATPFTATDEYLEGWAALVDIYRIAATTASGTVTFPGTNGVTLPSGTTLTRGDGQEYLTTASATVASGVVTVSARAVADPTGQAGAIGNCDAGTVLTIGSAIAGISSSGTAATAFIGGADLEQDASLRARMLLEYQNPPQGGDALDYVEWALAVPGVTRAWCVPNIYGAGTVGVYVMFDNSESTHSGFPQGTNGVSQNDEGQGGTPRGVVATGDQLTVADALSVEQPVTALVTVLAPVAAPQNFTIANIDLASDAVKTAISTAISNVFLQYSEILAGTATLDISLINSAIAAIAGTSGFVITSPAGNIQTTAGQIPTLGTITYSTGDGGGTGGTGVTTGSGGTGGHVSTPAPPPRSTSV